MDILRYAKQIANCRVERGPDGRKIFEFHVQMTVSYPTRVAGDSSLLDYSPVPFAEPDG